MAKNSRRITNQLGRSQVTGLVDKNLNSLLADSEADGFVSFDNVRIHGDLKVYGSQSVVNSSTLTIADKNIVIAKGAYDSDQYNNAGITIADSDELFERGTSPSFQYNGQKDAWVANRKILVNVNKEQATDSDALVTTNSFSAVLSTASAFTNLKSKVDSDADAGEALKTDIASLKSRLDSDSTTIQKLQTQHDSDSALLSIVNNRITEIVDRLDSDQAVVQSLQTAVNANTASIDVAIDSDSIVNMFNEYALLNTTTDSDTMKTLFQKVVNDFEVKDVNGNVVFAFFTRP